MWRDCIVPSSRATRSWCFFTIGRTSLPRRRNAATSVRARTVAVLAVPVSAETSPTNAPGPIVASTRSARSTSSSPVRTRYASSPRSPSRMSTSPGAKVAGSSFAASASIAAAGRSANGLDARRKLLPARMPANAASWRANSGSAAMTSRKSAAGMR